MIALHIIFIPLVFSVGFRLGFEYCKRKEKTSEIVGIGTFMKARIEAGVEKHVGTVEIVET